MVTLEERLKAELERQKTDLEKSWKKELDKLKEELETKHKEYKKELEKRDNTIQDLSSKLAKKEEEIRLESSSSQQAEGSKEMQERLNEVKNEKDQTNEELKQKTIELERITIQLEEEKRKHSAELEELKKKYNEEKEIHEKAITEKTEELEKLASQLEDEKRKTIDNKGVHEDGNLKKIKELEKSIEELKTENKELQEDFEKRIQLKKQPKPTRASDDVSALKEENESLKNRLSQLAGAKLTEGNPNIADLSDKNRPINLAEKFSELYDNEWTDALEELMDSEKKSEEEGIDILFHIVKDAYEFCSKQSTTLYKSMTKGIKDLGLLDEKMWPQGLSKQIKDHRKSISVLVSNNLSKEFLKSQKHTVGKATSKYAEACAALCWFMCVQDPPVYMDPSVPKGNFDTDKYRAYTKTGKDYKYLVWPPLYLHKEGPMLGKGIAQGK
ncbi:myosin-11-like [Saccostrea echinata]|uniref:myosin-11-like n=1 Tax=Saccostrea echinata TaxID=191078 RepID=UPI002A8229CB|nr:myosin-11-like [Saccostrea echinata]